MSLAQVGGVFVLLFAGCAVAMLVALCEFIWKSRKLALHDDGNIGEEMGRQLYNSMCLGNTKPVRQNDPPPSQ